MISTALIVLTDLSRPNKFQVEGSKSSYSIDKQNRSVSKDLTGDSSQDMLDVCENIMCVCIDGPMYDG
jgi:hypothetical protein